MNDGNKDLNMPDSDVEPEPCRDCLAPIPPNMMLCEDCDEAARDRGRMEPMDPKDVIF